MAELQRRKIALILLLTNLNKPSDLQRFGAVQYRWFKVCLWVNPKIFDSENKFMISETSLLYHKPVSKVQFMSGGLTYFSRAWSACLEA
jgi:hypothetical protein